MNKHAPSHDSQRQQTVQPMPTRLSCHPLSMINDRLAWLVMLVCLCFSNNLNAEPTAGAQVKVLAAASLSKVINPLAKSFSQQNGVTITPIFASSGSLAKQIEQGVPADMFISADEQWVKALQGKKLVASATPWVGNQLVIITPVAQSASIDFSSNLPAKPWLTRYWCTGDPLSVPVGRYAQQALTQLGWWERVKPQLVLTQDVRAALHLVERGECDVGIVYASDAYNNANVHVAGIFDERTHLPIIYPIAMLPKTSVISAAFNRYLRSPEAKQLLQQAGFIPLF